MGVVVETSTPLSTLTTRPLTEAPTPDLTTPMLKIPLSSSPVRHSAPSPSPSLTTTSLKKMNSSRLNFPTSASVAKMVTLTSARSVSIPHLSVPLLFLMTITQVSSNSKNLKSLSVKESVSSRSKSAVTPVPVDVLLFHTRLCQDLPKVVVLIILTLSVSLNSTMTKLQNSSRSPLLTMRNTKRTKYSPLNWEHPDLLGTVRMSEATLESTP